MRKGCPKSVGVISQIGRKLIAEHVEYILDVLGEFRYFGPCCGVARKHCGQQVIVEPAADRPFCILAPQHLHSHGKQPWQPDILSDESGRLRHCQITDRTLPQSVHCSYKRRGITGWVEPSTPFEVFDGAASIKGQVHEWLFLK